MAEKVAFPVSVGPFTTTSVAMAPALNAFYRAFPDFPKPNVESAENMMGGWDLSSTCGAQMDVTFSQLSPLYKLTLDDEAKAAANMPLAATSFAWAYPAVLDPFADFSRVPADQVAFLQFGGYVYFDDRAQAVGTLGVVPAEVGALGLSFGRPQPLPEAVVTRLTQQGRFQDVTLDALTSKGATHFAWIRPEEFSDSIANPNGAFAYKFAGSISRFYPVVTTPVFTKDIVSEELDDTESWVVLRCCRPPQQDQLLIMDKSLPADTLLERTPAAKDWLLAGDRLKIYRDSAYRSDGGHPFLTFEAWQGSAEAGDLADPWVFEISSAA